MVHPFWATRGWSLDAKVAYYTDAWPVGPHGCYAWKGPTNTGGYGQLKHDGRMVLIHRYLYAKRHRRWPKAAMHKCDHPWCVREDHIKAGTPGKNNSDRASKGRNGYHKGVANSNATLSEAQVRAIRQSKLPASVLAPRYNVSKGAIWYVRRRETWKHI